MKVLAFLMLQTVLFPQQEDISLEVIKGETPQPWAFIAPHENENIANQYVAEKIKKHGGTFVILQQFGNRLIQLEVEGNKVMVDPNRIFTAKGRSDTLQKLNAELMSNPSVYEAAINKTESLADFIFNTMGTQAADIWIAIHNNTNGYDNDGKNGRGTISIKRYQKKLDAGVNYLIKVHDADIDEDDLFFLTDPKDFVHTSKAKWNVVLQNPKVATDPSEDDGSLSVLAEMQGKRYINIEAERSDDGFGEDHLEQQKAMVDLIFSILTTEE
ncbi:hypothetical protein [Glaciecola sp. 1036]|uniref:hypothetical protein n=1 Tax=Alteromonadaceae TaxID=72275 RepID=UPI003D054862